MLSDLKILLRDEKNILFVGIGNQLKSDDGIGVYISKRIKNSECIFSLTAEASIENYIGKINSISPDILVLIDCADINRKPGSCRLLPVDMVKDLTFNTHSISLSRISEFFEMPVYVLGIQPEKVDFGENISYLVKTVADKILQTINKQEVYHGC